jgi:hypothetical protein
VLAVVGRGRSPNELVSPAIARKYAVSEGDRKVPTDQRPTKTKRKYDAAKFKKLK